MTPDAGSTRWVSVKYPCVRLPAKGGKVASGRRPALRTLVRHPGSAPGSDSRRAFEAYGVLDTGADAPVMPMWSLRRLGIPLDKKSKREVYGVSGPFWSYSAKVGLEIECGGRWLDVGTARVHVPDTPWSRNPHTVLPLLLGLNGVFDRIHMCIDHSREAFRIGIPNGAQTASRQTSATQRA